MTTIHVLLLLVGATATLANPYGSDRERRAVASSASAVSAGAGSFASASVGVGPGMDSGFSFPSGPFNPSTFESMFRSYFDQLQKTIAQQQALAASFHAQLGNALDAGLEPGFGVGGVGGAGAGSSPGPDYALGSGPAGAPSSGGRSYTAPAMGGAATGAQASLAVGPQGGFGQASLYPDPALASRVSGNVDPLGGQGSYGVFSSASASSSDINGRRSSFKQAVVGVNDNGKVTTFTAKDP